MRGGGGGTCHVDANTKVNDLIPADAARSLRKRQLGSLGDRKLWC